MTSVNIKQKIQKALAFDDAGRYQEACIEYFSSMFIMMQALQQQVTTPSLSPDEIAKYCALIRQSLERSEDILITQFAKGTKQVNQPTETPSSAVPPIQNQPPSKSVSNKTANVRNSQIFLGASSKQENQPQKQHVTSSFQSAPVPLELQSDPQRVARWYKVAEEAEKAAEGLNISYQQKLNKLKSTVSNPIVLQRDIADLNLYFIRQKLEIEAIAREKQRQILAEVQNATVTNSNEKEKRGSFTLFKRTDSKKTDNYSEFKMLISADKVWQKQLAESPESARVSLIQTHLTEVLGHPNHPLGNRTIEFIMKWKHQSISIEPNSFDSLRDLIRPNMESIEKQIYKCYPELDSPDDIATNVVIIHCIEQSVFPRIYQNLFELYKFKHMSQDKQLQEKCIEFSGITPERLGVPKNLLVNSVASTFDGVTEKLRKISGFQTPTEKLNCLLETSKDLVETIVKLKKDGESVAIGADQLLPLFTYVVIRANIPSSYSESIFLTDFISEKALMGEMGYTLASFHTCLQYILNTSLKDLDETSKDDATKENSATVTENVAPDANSVDVAKSESEIDKEIDEVSIDKEEELALEEELEKFLDENPPSNPTVDENK